MTENDKIGRIKAQEGGFHLREEIHLSEPTLDGHLETLNVLRQAKENGMKRATVMSPEGPITLPIDKMIEIVENLVGNQIGDLPPQG